MGLFDNYNAPENRGVLRTPHEKRGIFKFFEIYGRHAWKLMELNLLYFLFCVPLFAMLVLLLESGEVVWIALAIPSVIVGPATAAMTKVARNFSQERPAFVLHDFFDAFKKNMNQGLVMGTIDVVFILGFIVGIPVYKQLAAQNSMMYVPYVICLSCMLIFVMMHFFIYQLICSTNLSMGKILKNSLLLVTVGIKNTLWTLLVLLVVLGMCYLLLPLSALLIPFWPLTFVAVVACFNCYPLIRKYVIQPYYDQRGEENPEFAYLKGEDGEEALFEDRSAEETPVKEQKKKKKKTIS
ncbi:MAG: DUF624 domain-containing protein [Ruminococcus sp.]|nr:DUF624 domain-containing protein [Ruminococcus sp.]